MDVLQSASTLMYSTYIGCLLLTIEVEVGHCIFLLLLLVSEADFMHRNKIVLK